MTWRVDVFFKQISLRWNFPDRGRSLPGLWDLMLRMTRYPRQDVVSAWWVCSWQGRRPLNVPWDCFSSAIGVSQGHSSASSLLQLLSLRHQGSSQKAVCMEGCHSLPAQVRGPQRDSCLPLPTSQNSLEGQDRRHTAPWGLLSIGLAARQGGLVSSLPAPDHSDSGPS